MTHSGGKPHAVGDRGQRYEVSFFNPTTNERQVMGWTDDIEAARKMADAVDAHPSWEFPWVTDRQALPPAHDPGCATFTGGMFCNCRLRDEALKSAMSTKGDSA